MNIERDLMARTDGTRQPAPLCSCYTAGVGITRGGGKEMAIARALAPALALALALTSVLVASAQAQEAGGDGRLTIGIRSEERRVGKEGRARWWAVSTTRA